MDINEIPSPTPSEIRAYELKARELRAEASADLFRAAGKGIAGLFRKLTHTGQGAHA